jgi:hydroxypyruvate reductase
MTNAELNKIIQATLRAADPAEAIRRHAQRVGGQLVVDGAAVELANKDIRVVAVGKAAAPMAQAVRDLLGDYASRCVVVTKYGHAPMGDARRPTVVIESAHPVPDENSVRGGDAVCQLLEGCHDNTLVIACISGGASALCIAPHEGIALRTMQAINDALLRSGADIVEMNAVRSRLDRLKGGGLVHLAQPAQVLGLILSDVIGDPLHVIASGMTNEPRAQNVLVGNNTQACEAAAQACRDLGYATKIVTTQMRGEARERGAEIAQSLSSSFADPLALGEGRARGKAFVYGGETTVTIRGDGKGGRNQELALAAALALRDDGLQTNDDPPSVVRRPSLATVIALGTDGTDGPTDAAGAIATSATCARAAQLNLNPQDFLNRNDSYHFFEQLGDLILTGPTGTNVADVVIALAE